MSEQPKKPEWPASAVFCAILGCLMILIGCAMLISAIISIGQGAPGTGNFLATALALVFGSIFWFALARIVALLNQIALNTSSLTK
jgi:hypothetical protein